MNTLIHRHIHSSSCAGMMRASLVRPDSRKISAVSIFTFLMRIIVVASAALMGLNASGEDRDRILREKRVLSEEHSLAKEPALYFMIDIHEKKLELRARGIVLREWNMSRARLWGKPLPLKRLTLVKKSALFPPKRKNIEPGEEDKDSFELDTFEIIDMPASYVFSFEEGVTLYIRPRAQNVPKRIANSGHFLRWHIWLPLKTLWFSVKKKSLSAIDIRLENKAEAQALFWAFSEGIKGIMFGQ